MSRLNYVSSALPGSVCFVNVKKQLGVGGFGLLWWGKCLTFPPVLFPVGKKSPTVPKPSSQTLLSGMEEGGQSLHVSSPHIHIVSNASVIQKPL